MEWIKMLFKQKPSSQDLNPEKLIRTLRLVMEKVGGYEQLINLPIPTYTLIVQDLNREAEEQERQMKKRGRK